MDFFKELSAHLPDDWQEEDYSNQTYVLVDLDEDSCEYKDAVAVCLRNCITGIKKIQRIQHPFAYLRYQLRNNFHRKWQHTLGPGVHKKIVSIDDKELDLYIRDNCDERRRTDPFGTNYVIQEYVNVYPDRDTNRYPLYVVKRDV